MRHCFFSISFVLLSSVALAEEQPSAGGAAAKAAPTGSARLEMLRKRAASMRERIESLPGVHPHRERIRMLRAEIHAATLKKEPDAKLLAKKTQELSSLRAERVREDRATALEQWGEAARQPEAKQELERHAERVARLERMRYLAATARKGPQRLQMNERLARLEKSETVRHLAKMTQLTGKSEAEPVYPGVKPVVDQVEGGGK